MDYNYSYSTGGGAAGVFFTLVWIAVAVVTIIGLWKTLSKAGLPGWAAIIPFYNEYNVVKMSNRPVYFFWIMLACSLFAWIPTHQHHPDHRHLRALGLHRPRHRRQLRAGHRLRDPAHHLPVDHVPDPRIRECHVQPHRRSRLSRFWRAAHAGRRQLHRDCAAGRWLRSAAGSAGPAGCSGHASADPGPGRPGDAGHADRGCAGSAGDAACDRPRPRRPPLTSRPRQQRPSSPRRRSRLRWRRRRPRRRRRPHPRPRR